MEFYTPCFKGALLFGSLYITCYFPLSCLESGMFTGVTAMEKQLSAIPLFNTVGVCNLAADSY